MERCDNTTYVGTLGGCRIYTGSYWGWGYANAPCEYPRVPLVTNQYPNIVRSRDLSHNGSPLNKDGGCRMLSGGWCVGRSGEAPWTSRRLASVHGSDPNIRRSIDSLTAFIGGRHI